jgi:hypothetical protein
MEADLGLEHPRGHFCRLGHGLDMALASRVTALASRVLALVLALRVLALGKAVGFWP